MSNDEARTTIGGLDTGFPFDIHHFCATLP